MKKKAAKKPRKKPYRWPHPFGKLKTPRGARVQDTGQVLADNYPTIPDWADYDDEDYARKRDSV